MGGASVHLFMVINLLFSEVNYGVMQCFILGPKLFSASIQSVVDIAQKSGIECYGYANEPQT